MAEEDSKTSLEELIKRKSELELLAHACAVAGQELPAEVQEEYLRIEAQLKAQQGNKQQS